MGADQEIEIPKGQGQRSRPQIDSIRLLVMCGLRSFAYGMLAVVLGVALSADRGGRQERQSRGPRIVPPLGRSRGIVLGLSGLFSVDALAGGLVVQSLLVLFFHLCFGIPLALLAALFFGANVLSALSFLAAVPLARKIGLLNTMVFTHLPSNVLLVLVPLMPTFPWQPCACCCANCSRRWISPRVRRIRWRWSPPRHAQPAPVSPH